MVKAGDENGLRAMLVQQFGQNHGTRYYFELASGAKSSVDANFSTIVSESESDYRRVGLIRDMQQANTTSQLDEAFDTARALFETGNLHPQHFREAIGSFQDFKARLPFRWESNEAAQRVVKQMELRYQSTAGGIVETALREIRDVAASRAMETLRIEAMTDWDAYIAGVVAEAANAGIRRFGLNDIDQISRQWERTRGSEYINRAATIATDARARTPTRTGR